MIKSKKLREHQYREESARSLEVEWDGENNVQHMWEQVKQAKVKGAREVCGSVQYEVATQKVCGGMIR